jgi:chromate reductase, NAD(P)H dehydrogenase (quinone)
LNKNKNENVKRVNNFMSKIILFSCTNRPNSFTLKVSRIYKDILSSKGIECELFSFEKLPENLMVSDTYGNRSSEFEAVIKQYISGQDYFVFIVPEYNGGFPGVLKLFLDAVPPREWTGKKACLVGVSSGRAGNLRGMEHLTGILNYLKMHVFYNKLPISLIDKITDAGGKFVNADQLNVCEDQMNGFIKFCK